MLRMIVAVGASFLTMSVLGIATQVALLQFFFHAPLDGFELGRVPPAYLLANGVASLFYAVIGGCIAAALGKKYEAPTVLGALLLGTAIGGVVMSRGNQPLWYRVIVPFIGAVVATMAGYAWLGRPASAKSSSRKS